MLNILILTHSGWSEVRVSEFVPRVGDHVDVFYDPMPIVKEVIAYPSKKRVENIGARLNVPTHTIDAILIVS